MKSPLRVFSFLLVVITQLSTLGQSPQWFQQDNGLPNRTRGDDIYFIDQKTGWIARGTNGIYKTENGGQTWVKKFPTATNPNTAGIAHFRSIGFATPTHGWAGNLGPGSYDGSVTDPNPLYETTNGGDDWHPVQSVTQSGMKGVCSLYVLDSQHVYGGGRVRGPAYFIKGEIQGGQWTWTIQDLTAAGVMGGIMDIYFKDPMNGFVVGMDNNDFYTSVCTTPNGSGNTPPTPPYHGAIAKTINGGDHWDVVATTTEECCYFWKMSWPSANVGYASLQQNHSQSGIIFYKTTTGGDKDSWIQNFYPFSSIAPGMNRFLWQGIGFVDENTGWAGGDSSQPPNNFLYTSDGGGSWYPAGFDDSSQINRIRVVDPTLAYASGSKAYVYRIPVYLQQQPQNQTVCVGANVNFFVTPTGNQPFTYQWFKNGVDKMQDKTDATLTLNNVTKSDAGVYSVTVSNAWDSVQSDNALLSVASIPVTITSQPQGRSASSYTDVTLSVGTSGDPPITYQWKKIGANGPEILQNNTGPTLKLNYVTPTDSGTYSVVVNNPCGLVTSSDAILTVSPPPPSGLLPCPRKMIGDIKVGHTWARYFVITDFQNCISFFPPHSRMRDPYSFQIKTLFVPREWKNLPEVKKAQALLDEAAVGQRKPLYLFSQLQDKLKAVDLGIKLQTENANASVKQIRRSKNGVDFLVRDSVDKEMSFDLSGKLPKEAKEGDIFLVLTTAHDEKSRSSHAADAHFTEVLEVKATTAK